LPLIDLAADGPSIDQMKCLGERWIRCGFLGTDRRSSTAAERGKEIIAGSSVGDLHSACTDGQSPELLFGHGDLRDAIEHVLCGNATNRSVRVVPQILFIARDRNRRTLVGLRIANVAHQLLEVVLVLDQLGTERIEQLRVARRVTRSEIVHGIDDPHAGEVCPNPVRYTLGEEGVFIAGHPFGQDDASVFPVGRRGASA